MSFFKIVEGAACIVSASGVYKHVGVAEREGLIYAMTLGGYVQLYANGSTSRDKLRVTFLSWPDNKDRVARTALGRLCRLSHADSVKLDDDTRVKLLGA